MRLKSGRYDILIIGAYLPPFTGNTKDFAKHKQTVDKVLSWCQGQIQQVPCRCTPILCLDLNDKLGYIQEEGLLQLGQGAHVGSCQPGVEGYSAMKFREVLEMEDMAAINTHYPSGDTYYGPSSSSRIDFICMPVGMLHKVETCKVLHRRGKSLQMISSRDLRDHIPLLVEADLLLDFSSGHFGLIKNN